MFLDTINNPQNIVFSGIANYGASITTVPKDVMISILQEIPADAKMNFFQTCKSFLAYRSVFIEQDRELVNGILRNFVTKNMVQNDTTQIIDMMSILTIRENELIYEVKETENVNLTRLFSEIINCKKPLPSVDFSNIPICIKKVVKVLNYLPSVVECNLNNCSLENENICALTELKYVTTLHLKNCKGFSYAQYETFKSGLPSRLKVVWDNNQLAFLERIGFHEKIQSIGQGSCH